MLRAGRRGGRAAGAASARRSSASTRPTGRSSGAFPPMSVTVVLADDLDVGRGDLICARRRRRRRSPAGCRRRVLDGRRRRCARARATSSSTRRAACARRSSRSTRALDVASLRDVAIAAPSSRSTTSAACACALAGAGDGRPLRRATASPARFILDRRDDARHGRAPGWCVAHARGRRPAGRPAQPGRRLARARAAAARALGHARPARRDRLAHRPAGVRQVDDRRGARAPRWSPTGRPAYLLDGENVRHGLSGDLGFTAADRHEHARRVAASRACSPTPGWSRSSPSSRPLRPTARARASCTSRRACDFVEAWVDTPLEECERARPAGLYARARPASCRASRASTRPTRSPTRPTCACTAAGEPVERSVERLLERSSWLSPSHHGAGAAPRLDPPADDPLRVDADQRGGQPDRLAAPADLDPARVPRVRAREVVDHDRGPRGAGDVAELLRLLERGAADVDRVAHRVVDPRDRDDVRRAVPPTVAIRPSCRPPAMYSRSASRKTLHALAPWILAGPHADAHSIRTRWRCSTRRSRWTSSRRAATARRRAARSGRGRGRRGVRAVVPRGERRVVPPGARRRRGGAGGRRADDRRGRRAVPRDETLDQRISDAFREKYGARSPGPTEAMVTPEVIATTMRLTEGCHIRGASAPGRGHHDKEAADDSRSPPHRRRSDPRSPVRRARIVVRRRGRAPDARGPQVRRDHLQPCRRAAAALADRPAEDA